MERFPIQGTSYSIRCFLQDKKIFKKNLILLWTNGYFLLKKTVNFVKSLKTPFLIEQLW